MVNPHHFLYVLSLLPVSFASLIFPSLQPRHLSRQLYSSDHREINFLPLRKERRIERRATREVLPGLDSGVDVEIHARKTVLAKRDVTALNGTIVDLGTALE
jgi:hypothetical protein